jgi:RNA polymerase sigma-70 factor (ECF subfamily)
MSEPGHVHVHVSSLPDEDLVARIRAGDMAQFEHVMRRHNQRLYRVARAIVRDDDGAEDVVQQAYVQAYVHLDQFGGRAQLSTWLTRIVIHEALARRRRQQLPLASLEDDKRAMSQADPNARDPERLAYAGELRALLERAIDALPDAYRLVFMCRDVEGMTTAETAEALELGDEAVKTRLHRARAMLRRDLLERAGAATGDAFAFHRSRCDSVVRGVFEELSRKLM